MADQKYYDDGNYGALIDGLRFPISNGVADYYSTPANFRTYVFDAYAGQTTITTVGTITNGTWSGKFAPRFTQAVSTASIVMDSDDKDVYILTALAGALSIDASVFPVPHRNAQLELVIKDNGTDWGLSFTANIIETGVKFPTRTVPGETMHLVFKYDFTLNVWKLILNTNSFVSPAFTGTPTAPTASPGTNTTQLATTAFVLANAGTIGGSIAVNQVAVGSGTNTISGSANYVKNSDGVRIINGATSVQFGNQIGGTAFSALYLHQATPSASNYTLINDNNDLFIQSQGRMNFRISGSTFIQLGAPGVWKTAAPIYIGDISTSPTAKLHIAAGTTAAGTAPLKFVSGSLLTTAEVGAHEFLTDKFYATITTGAARKELTLNDIALTSGRIPFITTNGRLTDSSLFTFSTSAFVLGAGVAATIATVAGSGSRFVTTDSTGVLASQKIRTTDPTAITNITDPLNWTGSAYTGPALTNLFAGQHYSDATYFFYVISDNNVVRMLLS